MSGVRAVLLLCLAGLLLLVGRVAAHGGGLPRLVNEPHGDYLLSAWSLPEPMRADLSHITVALARPVAGRAPEAVLNETVWVVMRNSAGEEVARMPATHENAANKLFYETDFSLPEAGEWHFSIQVAGQEASADFSATVLPASTARWRLPALGVGGLVLLLAFWLRSNQKPASR
jgi:hypothetical protein